MRLVRLGAVPLGECFRFGASPRDHNYMRVTPRGKLSSSYLLLRQEGDAPFGFPGLSLELFSLPSAVVVHPVRVGFRVMVHGVGVEVGNIPCLARTVVSIPRFEGSTLALLLRGGDGGEIGEAESRRFGFGTLVHRRYALDLVTGEETFSLGASAQVVPVKLGFEVLSEGEEAERAWSGAGRIVAESEEDYWEARWGEWRSVGYWTDLEGLQHYSPPFASPAGGIRRYSSAAELQRRRQAAGGSRV